MSDSGTSLGKFVFYHYSPSVPAAVIFTAIFGASGILHLYQIIRTRTFFFIPMFIGALMEAIGYAARTVSHQDTKALGPYIVQSLLLLVAPAFFAASIYIILGRIIILADGEPYSLIRVRFLTKIFVFGDVISFFVQSAGGGMLPNAKTQADVDRGNNIILAGLALQVIFFGIFIVISFMFHIRMSRTPTNAAKTHEKEARVPWRTMLYVLYASSILILIRSVFRLVEYTQGNDGYLLKNEVWLYIFDAVLISISAVLFNWYHPSKMLLGPGQGTDRHEMSTRYSHV